jgi:hypothetical protein
MPEHAGRKGGRGALERLYDFLEAREEDVTSLPLERVLKDLKKDRIDPAPLVDMVQEYLAKAQAAETLMRAREERRRVDALRPRVSAVTTIEGLRERARRVTATLSGPQLEAAAVFHRKLEGATDADVQSMLDDLELLEKLGQQDDEQH